MLIPGTTHFCNCPSGSCEATLEGSVEDGAVLVRPAKRQENFLANCLASASAVASAI